MRRLEPATTSAAVSLPFLVGCHSLAIAGNNVARQLERQTFCPAQYGHPGPLLVLSLITACQVCSLGFSGHFHQTFSRLLGAVFFADALPFLLWCHCLASCGCFLASDTPENSATSVTRCWRAALELATSWHRI